jgi:hypothetical protein
MTHSREMQPVWRPHAHVFQLAQRPHIGDVRIMARRDGTNILIADRDFAPHPTKYRRHSDVGAGEEN